MQSDRQRADGGVDEFNQLPDVAPDKMPQFLKSVDEMDHVSVEIVDERPLSFDVKLEYDEAIRLVRLKVLGQDMGARGFEAKDDFRPGEDNEQVWEWTHGRYIERVVDRE